MRVYANGLTFESFARDEFAKREFISRTSQLVLLWFRAKPSPNPLPKGEG